MLGSRVSWPCEVQREMVSSSPPHTPACAAPPETPSAAAGSTDSGEGGSAGPGSAPPGPPPCSGMGQARR